MFLILCLADTGLADTGLADTGISFLWAESCSLKYLYRHGSGNDNVLMTEAVVFFETLEIHFI
jgi:hypothetical protein